MLPTYVSYNTWKEAFAAVLEEYHLHDLKTEILAEFKGCADDSGFDFDCDPLGENFSYRGKNKKYFWSTEFLLSSIQNMWGNYFGTFVGDTEDLFILSVAGLWKHYKAGFTSFNEFLYYWQKRFKVPEHAEPTIEETTVTLSYMELACENIRHSLCL